MNNKEKFLKLVSDEKTSTIEILKERIKNDLWIRESEIIALKMLLKLDKLGWTQKDLADKMAVSPQYVSKIVQGKENLTLETIAKIQEALDIPILASYIENKNREEKNTPIIAKVVAMGDWNQYIENISYKNLG